MYALGMVSFTRDTKIFSDRSPLAKDYQPEEIVAREEEMSEYQDLLQPAIDGDRPDNIFLYGPTGVGKTAATNHIMAQLANDANQFDDINIGYTTVNCKGKSAYHVCIELTNAIRPSSDDPAKHGMATAEVYKTLWEELDRSTSTLHFLFLDEVDSLGTDDDFLYKLSRANSAGDVQTDITVIGACNKLNYTDLLSKRVKSTLCEQKLHFTKYDANQLKEILTQRVDKAFHEGALDDEVIPYVSAKAAKEDGDARRALRILRKAGNLAVNRELDEVQTELVDEAVSKVRDEMIQDSIMSMPRHQQIVLWAIAQLDEEDETPAPRRTIQDRYELLCDRCTNVTAKASRTVRDKLNDLSLVALVNRHEENRGKAGGRYMVYELDVDSDVVISGIRSTSLGEYMTSPAQTTPR